MERDLAIRQLAVKDFKSRCWFITIQGTFFLKKKNSMEISSEIALRKSVVGEARLKSTLRYLNFENFQIGHVHKLWSRDSANDN